MLPGAFTKEIRLLLNFFWSVMLAFLGSWLLQLQFGIYVEKIKPRDLLTMLFLRAVALKFNTRPGSGTKRGRKTAKGSDSLDFFEWANRVTSKTVLL